VRLATNLASEEDLPLHGPPVRQTVKTRLAAAGAAAALSAARLATAAWSMSTVDFLVAVAWSFVSMFDGCCAAAGPPGRRTMSANATAAAAPATSPALKAAAEAAAKMGEEEEEEEDKEEEGIVDADRQAGRAVGEREASRSRRSAAEVRSVAILNRLRKSLQRFERGFLRSGPGLVL
jgi:hypothetical protein